MFDLLAAMQPTHLIVLVQFNKCWSYAQLYRLWQHLLEEMKTARDIYSQCKRRVKRLQKRQKAKDVSGVSDAAMKTAESFKQAEVLIAEHSDSLKQLEANSSSSNVLDEIEQMKLAAKKKEDRSSCIHR